MDPLDCDGEANPRPISPSAALALIPAADAIGNGLVRDNDDCVDELPWSWDVGDCGGPPAEPTHDIRAAIEAPHERSLWGQRITVEPRLLAQVFGDGARFFCITPTFTRPKYYVVRGDSSWMLDDIAERIDQIQDAIEEEFGCAEDCGDECPDDCDKDHDLHAAWPRADFSGGCSWGDITDEIADLAPAPPTIDDCDDTPTIDADVLGYLDEIREVVALATVPRRCTLCSCEIPAHARRLVWSWANDNDENLVLHAHRGCDAIRREIDLGEWSQGDLVDRLVEWHEEDRLNHDLGKLYLDLTNEQLDDMGKEIIAAAIGSVADDSDTDVDSACIMRHAATSPMSKGRIEMAVLGCSTDVESVTVTDNPTVEPATVDGVTLPALSIRVVVSPSTLSPEALENVARAIHDHTSLGVETVGDCCIVLVGLDGIGRSIRFDLVDRAAL